MTDRPPGGCRGCPCGAVPGMPLSPPPPRCISPRVRPPAYRPPGTYLPASGAGADASGVPGQARPLPNRLGRPDRGGWMDGAGRRRTGPRSGAADAGRGRGDAAVSPPHTPPRGAPDPPDPLRQRPRPRPGVGWRLWLRCQKVGPVGPPPPPRRRLFFSSGACPPPHPPHYPPRDRSAGLFGRPIQRCLPGAGGQGGVYRGRGGAVWGRGAWVGCDRPVVGARQGGIPEGMGGWGGGWVSPWYPPAAGGHRPAAMVALPSLNYRPRQAWPRLYPSLRDCDRGRSSLPPSRPAPAG